MSAVRARRKLIGVLRAAYSAERAAAIAYAGHARSVRDVDQRRAIWRVRDEELAHRARVGEMLAALGAAPRRWRELAFAAVGKLIALFCYVGGWFAPMYGAGWIEKANIGQYERAARWAHAAGFAAFADELLAMAEVEHAHEALFRGWAASHWLARALPIWRPPPPRADIRAAFERWRAPAVAAEAAAYDRAA